MCEVIIEDISQMKVYEKYELLSDIDFLLENIEGKSQVISEKNRIKRLWSVIKGDYNEATNQIIMNYNEVVSNTVRIQQIIIDDIRRVKEDLQKNGQDIADMEENLELIMTILYTILPDIAKVVNKDYTRMIKQLNVQIKKTIKRIMETQAEIKIKNKNETANKITYNPTLLLLSPAASYLLRNGEWESIYIDSNLKDYYFSNNEQIIDIGKRLNPDIVIMPDITTTSLNFPFADIRNSGFPNAETIDISDFYAYLWFWNMAESFRINSEIAIIDHYDTAFSGSNIRNLISTEFMGLKKYTVNDGVTLKRYDYGRSFNYSDFKFMIIEEMDKLIGKKTKIIRTFTTERNMLEKKLNKMNILPLERYHLQLLSGTNSAEQIKKMINTVQSIQELNENML